ncbi:putative ABC transporter substrate-binding protein YesO [Oxobacter pfennigii]|uniref:Putative ABC transporter substrate-binding protein YesO n=1 Tax=Oxobacter pfennigii TaxID=36849 RepID=A0A0N8NTY7_9CLOT|nr:extracellular solute-binding protein [Oxobacter pfennigii]KPU46144.1 putative ABC transporter substrate-binding protein YesO [Oxobacter pfennigii]
MLKNNLLVGDIPPNPKSSLKVEVCHLSLSKKILKRITCLVLAVFTSSAITACGSTANNNSKETSSGNNTLTVSVMTKDMYLDTAVKLFEEQHPGVTIDVKEYTSNPLPASDGKNTSIRVGEKPEDVEKYVSAMNTQLMSGNGTDIMLLSPLPYENYIDKNMLVNLSDMIQSDESFDMGKYYANILDAMKYNGNLYGLPLSVNLNVLEANKALLDKYNIDIDDSKWSWEDFEQAAQEIVENSKKDGAQGMYALSGMDGSTIMSSLVSESYDKFVDKNEKAAGFDSREFVALLNMAKSMIDSGYVNTDTSQGKITDLAARGNTVFSAGGIRNYMDMMMAKQTYSDGVEFLNYPGEGAGLSFTTNTLYGISNNSSNKELAWEFLKFLASDEMMSQNSLVGLPVNKTASEKSAQNAVEMSKKVSSSNGNAKIMMNMNGQSINLNKPITEEDVKVIQELLTDAEKYTNADQKVLSIIREETAAFFAGQKTAEDTAKTIQDRVNTYINE